MFKNKIKTVKIIKNNLNISNLATCSDAKLVHINGIGSLKENTKEMKDSYYGYRYLSNITLNEVPLIQINAPGCPTCASLLATGYGIENTNCSELNEIRDRINSDFINLDKSILDLSPLLKLLESGLYVIVDMMCYPTNGEGDFFWDIPNDMTEYEATAGVLLTDEDNEYDYVGSQPVFIYPTQNTDCFSEERVTYYMDKYKNTDTISRAIAYNCSEFMNVLLDGHHKACAATLLEKPVHCITIIPFSGCSYTFENDEEKIESLNFSSFEISADDIPKNYLSKISKRRKKLKMEVVNLFESNIINKHWESKYIESASNYPTAAQYADMVAADVNEITDKLIEDCLNNLVGENINKIKYIIFVLDNKKDPRVKNIALQCAKQLNYCKLKVQVFKVLNRMKNDEEIEQFFVDYLIEDNDTHSLLVKIANSYWD